MSLLFRSTIRVQSGVKWMRPLGSLVRFKGRTPAGTKSILFLAERLDLGLDSFMILVSSLCRATRTCVYPVLALVLKKTSGSPDVFQHQEATRLLPVVLYPLIPLRARRPGVISRVFVCDHLFSVVFFFDLI